MIDQTEQGAKSAKSHVEPRMERVCIWLIATLWFIGMAGCASRPEKPAAVPVSPGSIPAAKPGHGSKMSARDIEAIIAYHNKVRADVGVGPMKWSAGLAAYAQGWADQLAGTTCKMAHRTQPQVRRKSVPGDNRLLFRSGCGQGLGD